MVSLRSGSEKSNASKLGVSTLMFGAVLLVVSIVFVSFFAFVRRGEGSGGWASVRHGESPVRDGGVASATLPDDSNSAVNGLGAPTSVAVLTGEVQVDSEGRASLGMDQVGALGVNASRPAEGDSKLSFEAMNHEMRILLDRSRKLLLDLEDKSVEMSSSRRLDGYLPLMVYLVRFNELVVSGKLTREDLLLLSSLVAFDRNLVRVSEPLVSGFVQLPGDGYFSEKYNKLIREVSFVLKLNADGFWSRVAAVFSRYFVSVRVVDGNAPKSHSLLGVGSCISSRDYVSALELLSEALPDEVLSLSNVAGKVSFEGSNEFLFQYLRYLRYRAVVQSVFADLVQNVESLLMGNYGSRDLLDQYNERANGDDPSRLSATKVGAAGG